MNIQKLLFVLFIGSFVLHATSHYLFVSVPFAGHYLPLLKISLELCENGITCQFASYDNPRIISTLNGTNIEFLSFGSPIEEDCPPLKGQYPIMNYIDCVFDALGSDVYLKLSRLYSSKQPPNVIVADFLTYGGIAFGKANHIPVYSNTPGSVYLQSDPWLYPCQLTGVSWLSSSLLEKLNTIICKLVGIPSLQALPLASLKHVSGLDNILPNFEFYNTIFGLEYLRPVPPNVYLTGTLIRTNVQSKKEKLIYISSGSVFSWDSNINERIYRAVLDFATKNPGFKIVWQANQSTFANSSIIHFYPWVDQLEILNRSALVICHGGFNTVIESLFFEVPVAIIPIISDQLDNGIRVADARVGFNLGRSPSQERIFNSLYSMQQPTVKNKVKELSLILQNTNGLRIIKDHLILANKIVMLNKTVNK